MPNVAVLCPKLQVLGWKTVALNTASSSIETAVQDLSVMLAFFFPKKNKVGSAGTSNISVRAGAFAPVRSCHAFPPGQGWG